MAIRWTRRYGYVAYLRHLANPEVKEKQPFLSPASSAPEDIDPADLPLLALYKGALAEKSTTELEDAYLQRLSNVPLDLVIREEILSNLTDLALEGREKALNTLMLLAPDEPDTYLRWYIVLAVGSIADHNESHHSDVIAFLKDMLEVETDIRRVRPAIVATLEHLYGNEK